MLSHSLTEYAEREYRTVSALLQPSLQKELVKALKGLHGDEQTLLMLLYGTLPLSDTASVSAEVLLDYVRHSLRLRAGCPYCCEISEEDFLQFVFYPRINSEELTACRSLFYRMISPRIANLSATEAALEVNRWCAERVTYRSSDARTESPLTALLSGYGRCGEESVFTVTALRSIGIPARQVYVPLWAHCDDNHAWVEFLAEGEWHWLGACEPEPVPDCGWFNAAAARAPLVVWRSFCRYGIQEKPAELQGCCALYAVTDHYAEVSHLTVTVKAADGTPVPDAHITVSIANTAALLPLLSGRTDSFGRWSASLGRTALWISAEAGGLRDCRPVLLQENTCVELCPRSGNLPDTDVDFIPPAATARNRVILSSAQRAERRTMLGHCRSLLQTKLAQTAGLEAADDPALSELLHMAGGNAPELLAFCRNCSDAERPSALALLRSLSEKDRKDVRPALLQQFLSAAMALPESRRCDPNLISPRIGMEFLSGWHATVKSFFSQEQLTVFSDNPSLLSTWLTKQFPVHPERCYPAVPMTPSAILRAGCCDSTALLSAAVLRTAKVSARLNAAYGVPEYLCSGVWKRTDGIKPSCTLSLVPENGALYGSDFTLAAADGNILELSADADPAKPVFSLLPGRYLLTSVRRLPGGTCLCRLRELELLPDTDVRTVVSFRSVSPEQLLSDFPLPDFSLRSMNGTEQTAARPALLCWLRPGEEPSEHVLRELLDTASQPDCRVCLILPELKRLSTPVQSVLDSVPNAELLSGDFRSDADALARAVFLEPGVFPLLLLTDARGTGRWASAGYQVGAVPLALQLAKLL